MQSTERWLPVVGFEGLYEVSDLGRVRGLDRTDGQGRNWPGRIMKLTASANYMVVSLWRDGKAKMRRVHSLVLEAFVGPAPEGMEACHNDGNPLNNTPSNLRWDTHRENIADKYEHGTNRAATVTRCFRGHLFAEYNLVVADARNGRRRCLACNRAQGEVKRGRVAHVTQERADYHYQQILRAALGADA